MQIKSIAAVGAITLGLIVAGTGGAVAGSLIDGGDVQNGSLSGVDIKNASVGDADLAANSVDADEVENGTLTGADIKNETLTTADIDDGTINGSDLNETVVDELEARIDNGRLNTVYTSQTGGIYLAGTVLITVYAEGDSSVTVVNGQGKTVTCTSRSVENGGTGSCSASRPMGGQISVDGVGTYEAAVITLGG